MMQELRVAYKSIAWMAAIGSYLLVHYQQWLAATGYVGGAGVAVLVLWSLQQLVNTLGTTASKPGRWWWKGALWRYPLVLLVLWVVSKQPILFIIGFVAGITLLPVSVGVLAVCRTWQRPTWLSIRYWAPKTVRQSREL
jgi:hypothetical protein